MFLQVDTSFTFRLVAIKNPLLMLQPQAPMPPAALLAAANPPRSLASALPDFEAQTLLFPFQPKQEDRKIQVNGSSNHRWIAWTPLRSVSDVLTLMG